MVGWTTLPNHMMDATQSPLTAQAVLQGGPYARTTSAMSVLFTTTSSTIPVPSTCMCSHRNLRECVRVR